jgi:hypothetical protein
MENVSSLSREDPTRQRLARSRLPVGAVPGLPQVTHERLIEWEAKHRTPITSWIFALSEDRSNNIPSQDFLQPSGDELVLVFDGLSLGHGSHQGSHIRTFKVLDGVGNSEAAFVPQPGAKP